MPTPTVWSERDEPWPIRGWHDCTYSAVLMCLVYAGKTNYPHGIYTVSEREALERSDSRDDETGSTFTYTDEAIRNRYGVHMSRPSSDTAAKIRDLLETPGIAVALAGSYRTLAAGHPWRRWQPGFIGGHAVCVIPLGNGKVLWLDPLAPWGHKGDVGTVNDAMSFAWTSNAVRYIRKDSLVSIPDTSVPEEDSMTQVELTLFAKPRRFNVEAGTTVHGYDPKVSGPVKEMPFPDASGANADAVAVITQDPRRSPQGTFLRVINGVFEGYYVPVSEVSLAPDPGPEPVDCSAAVSEAVAPLKETIDNQKKTIRRLRSQRDEANTKIANAQAALVGEETPS